MSICAATTHVDMCVDGLFLDRSHPLGHAAQAAAFCGHLGGLKDKCKTKNKIRGLTDKCKCKITACYKDNKDTC